MYVLDEIRPLHIPYAEFNAVASYDSNYRPYGFRVLDEQKSLALLQQFPLISERHVPRTSEEEYEHALATLTGDLDRKIEASQRVEQAYLRKALFPGPDALYDLCGRRFEIEFLVAAHIKKRAACTDSERRDVSHAVMSACKFGCDELFERGYITITNEGALKVSKALQAASQAHSYAAEHLVGKTFGRPMAGREGYFDWHRTHAYRG
jgi:predicted restriction endonuclease